MTGSAKRGHPVWRDLFLFLGVALLFRVCFWRAMGRVVDSADAIHYLGAVKQLAAGNFMHLDMKIPLLYPLLCALFSKVVPDPELACRLVSFLGSTLLVVPVYMLAHDLHGRSTARIATLLAALRPWLADYGSRISTEGVACTLWFLAIWLFVRALRRGGLWTIGAALAFFALHLTRAEGTFLLLAAFPGATLLCVRDTRAKPVRLIPFAVVCAVLLMGHAFLMHRLTGTFTINTRTAYIVQDVATSNEFRTITETSLEYVKAAVDSLFQVTPIMLGPLLLMFLGVGLFSSTARMRDQRLEMFVLYFAAVQWLCSLTVASPAPRYLMTVFVALSIWSARGMLIVTRQAARLPMHGKWLRLLPIGAVLVTMALGTAVTLAAEHFGRRPRQPREYKVAGRWMQEHLEPGLIFTRKPQVAYYADMPSTGPALNESLEEALTRARAAGAAYLVVDERYTAQMAPALKLLLDPAAAPESLKLLREVHPDYPDARVVVYELLGASPQIP